MVRLTNVDYKIPHVKAKVNFFLNYLKHYASESGKSPFYPHDNILSITNRLEFQLTKNTKNAHRYLPSLIYGFQKFAYEFFNEISSIDVVANQLIEYQSLRNNNRKWNNNSRKIYLSKNSCITGKSITSRC